MNVELVTKEDLIPLYRKIEKLLEIVSKKESKIEYYSNNDLCKILNVSKRTLQNYRDTGQIDFVQNGRKIYYTADALKAYMNKKSVMTFNDLKNRK